MFKDDYELMNGTIGVDEMPDKAFCHLICEGVKFEQDM